MVYPLSLEVHCWVYHTSDVAGWGGQVVLALSVPWLDWCYSNSQTDRKVWPGWHRWWFHVVPPCFSKFLPFSSCSMLNLSCHISYVGPRNNGARDGPLHGSKCHFQPCPKSLRMIKCSIFTRKLIGLYKSHNFSWNVAFNHHFSWFKNPVLDGLWTKLQWLTPSSGWSKP